MEEKANLEHGVSVAINALLLNDGRTKNTNQKCYGLFLDGSKECHDTASFRLLNRISFAFPSRLYQRKLKRSSLSSKKC